MNTTNPNPNPHPHLNLTGGQLDALRDTTRALIDAAFGGDRKAYFDTVGPTGYVLTSSGWATSNNPGTLFDDPRCGITDHELIIDAEDDKRDDDGTPFRYATAEGIWVADFGHSGDRSPAQIGPDPYAKAAPAAEVDPVLVTASFETGGPMLWAECWWFDHRTAIPVITGRIDCGHRIDYQDAGGQVHPEMTIWQTADGRWVGRLTAPEEVNTAFADEDTVWCALDERYVAHALYCTDRTRLTREGRDLPLVRLVTGLARATSELILPTGKVYLDSQEAGSEPQRRHSEQAMRALTATLTSFIQI